MDQAVADKFCCVCKERKPIDSFAIARRRKDGRQTACRECNKTYKNSNLDRRRKTNNTWAAKNRYRVRGMALGYLYGITNEDYEKKLTEQDNGCALCGKTPEENGKRLDVDHNHVTGKVRGLLCSQHNKALGQFQDSSKLLVKAALYLRKWED